MTSPLLPNGYTLEQTESCIHRGDKKGFKSKGTGCTCNAKHRENVYSCALFGTCTVTRYSQTQTEKICSTCESTTPKENV